MAFGAKKIFPLDTKPSVGIGISLPFNAPQTFTQTYTTQDQVKSNIINYILTDKEERVFNLDFGSNIRRSLFENITPNTLKNLEITLNDDLSSYFPNINFTDIKITPNYDVNSISIEVRYSLYNGPINEINITL